MNIQMNISNHINELSIHVHASAVNYNISIIILFNVQ